MKTHRHELYHLLEVTRRSFGRHDIEPDVDRQQRQMHFHTLTFQNEGYDSTLYVNLQL